MTCNLKKDSMQFRGVSEGGWGRRVMVADVGIFRKISRIRKQPGGAG